MKKILPLILALSLGSTALAGNYAQLNATTRTLTGALQGEFDDSVTGIRAYLPNYGYQISMYNAGVSVSAGDAAARITTILKTLAPTVKGLTKTEYLSVIFKGTDKSLKEYELLVRIRGGKIERLLNGRAF